MLRVLVRNAISNWAGFAVNLVVTFLLTPFVLRSLGDTRYGVWVLVLGLTGYYGLFDLGFRSGISQYLTRHLATRDFDQLNRTASTAFVALSACGAVVLLVSLAVAWLAPLVFTIPPDAVREVRWCILVIGATTAVQFPCFPYGAVFTATQRYDALNAVRISIRIAAAIATYAALALGHGLVALAAVNAAGDLIAYALQFRVAHRILPELRIVPKWANWASLWAMTAYGIWSVVIQGANYLKHYFHAIVIGLFMPIAALAPYSLASGLVSHVGGMFIPIATVFFPLAASLDAQNDLERQRKMYLAGARVFFLGISTVALIAVVWAKDFFRLWVGSRFVEAGPYTSVQLLFGLLILGSVFAVGQRIGMQTLLGKRRMSVIAALLAAEAVATVVLALCLVDRYGLLGIALSNMIPAIAVHGLAYPVVLCRALGIPVATFVREVCLRPLLCGAALAGLLTAARTLLPAPEGWVPLVLYGAVSGLVGIALAAGIGLRRSEQQAMVAPVARLARRIGNREPSRGLKRPCESVANEESP